MSVPDDPTTLFLRTTFGVLVSRDAGKRWRWICERALGYEGQWDPPIAATRDGRLWVGLEDGLRVTRDGCEVETIAELDGETVRDLTTDARGETLFVITGAPGKRSWVWRRPGPAASNARFERLAGMDDVNVTTIEVAPSRPSRVYVSGQSYSTIRGQIHRSDDGGATFTTYVGGAGDAGASTGSRDGDAGAKIWRSSGELAADGPFFIGAVDPRDPNRLLVRHLHAKGSDLLVSRDGGRTFKNVLSMVSSMFGFAKSEDGTTYWAGSGLPEHGIFRSTDRGEHFEPTSNSGVLCLHRATSGDLFVCQNALSLGAPAIGVSHDQGKTVESLARFDDVEGPVRCEETDARASLCAGAWAETKSLLSADAGASGELDAGRPRRRKRDGGASGDGASEPSKSGRACGCEVVGATSSGPTDLRWLIAGIYPLAVRVRASLMRGSKLTQRRRNCST